MSHFADRLAIEKDIEEYTLIVNLGEHLINLRSNKDFIAVIETGYLDAYLKKLVNLSVMDNKHSEEYLEEVKGIGYLHKYLYNIEANLSIAKDSLREAKDTLLNYDREEFN